VSLRIAFDLDGTLADLDSALDRIAHELFPLESKPAAEKGDPAPAAGSANASAGTGASSGHAEAIADVDAEAVTPVEEQLEPPEVRALSRRQQHQVWDAVRRTVNFWESLDETEPGIVARIAAVAEERRWEVIFITHRPAANGDTTQRQSQRWLAARGFEMPSVFVLAPGVSRGQVATALALDAVVDDRPENCLDVRTDSDARAILVARQPGAVVAPNALRLGIEVVGTVGECLALLDATPAAKGGLIGRLRKAFGRS
jgi:hypothetical protein